MSNQPKVAPDHVHDWKPKDGAPGAYVCACGATGWRCNNGPDVGKIVSHKHKRAFEPAQRMHVAAGEGGSHKRHGRRGPGGWS